jgi:hypothetical protein
LRYEKTAGVGWRFIGGYCPSVKYFHPEHRIVELGSKPFLVVTGQGYAGTGVSSQVESWIDLSARKFDPILNFTSEAGFFP